MVEKMKREKKILLSSILTLIITFSFVKPTELSAKGIVIANPSINESDLDANTIRDIFLGRITKWKDGKRIIVRVLRSGPVHNEFLKRVVGKNARQFSTYWKKAVFTGTGIPHKSLASEEDMVKFISSTPGAIGYIDSSTLHPECKVIRIR
jgi:ABC-type phosphate transport system substrate-binding protein